MLHNASITTDFKKLGHTLSRSLTDFGFKRVATGVHTLESARLEDIGEALKMCLVRTGRKASAQHLRALTVVITPSVPEPAITAD